MTRRTSKHGTVYTEGSHQSLHGFPRVCYGCGGKVVLRRHHVWQETIMSSPVERRTWHHHCRLEAGAAARD